MSLGDGQTDRWAVSVPLQSLGALDTWAHVPPPEK